MNYKKRFATAIATGAVILNALAPAAFANDITVSGNGAFSDSTANVSNNNSTTVDQNNDAKVSNNVSSNASTGGNDASFNTGGNTTINTGSASTNTTVANDLNTNAAQVTPSSGNGGTNVNISGNGAFSDNKARVDDSSRVRVNQDNNANVWNNVRSNATTGHNNAGFNTGGDTSINTGDASTHTSVSTEANRNIADVSSGRTGGSNGSSVTISGNGAFSDNTARLNNRSSTVVDQNNDAKVSNHVRSNATTGRNDAGFNTGGDVSIDTGNAKATTDVSNAVNFNAADVNSGDFLGGTNVKIAGNGADSFNKVLADNSNKTRVSQDNNAKLHNDVNNNAKTGHNASKFSTGDVNGDPSIKTGNADTGTAVHNSGNTNVSGQGASLRFPNDLGVNFDFDLSGLFNSLSLHK